MEQRPPGTQDYIPLTHQVNAPIVRCVPSKLCASLAGSGATNTLNGGGSSSGNAGIASAEAECSPDLSA